MLPKLHIALNYIDFTWKKGLNEGPLIGTRLQVLEVVVVLASQAQVAYANSCCLPLLGRFRATSEVSREPSSRDLSRQHMHYTVATDWHVQTVR